MSTGGKTARSDLLGGAGWVFFGLLVVAESLRMDRFTSMGATLYTMPGFMPALIGSVVMVLGGLLMLRGWRHRASAEAPSSDNPAESPASEPLLNFRMLVTLPLTLMYAGLFLGRVPFWAATFSFVAAFTWLFMPDDTGRKRRAVVSVTCAAATTAVVMVVFQYVFLVRLP